MKTNSGSLRRILLVNPSMEGTVYSLHEAGQRMLNAKSFVAPLALATIAALTPSDIDLTLWDENVRGKLEGENWDWAYDLVAVTGLATDFPRVNEICRLCRARGLTVVIGGSGISAAPEDYVGMCDVRFIGEAEITWPAFIRDWCSGEVKEEYRQIEKPILEDSPLPRWDLLGTDIHQYLLIPLQTTRGCPFDCSFCDIIYLYGRNPRSKSVERVIQEYRMLLSMGISRIFLADDNFYGNPRYARDVLRALIETNKGVERPASFRTQLTLNVATDDEALALLADARVTILIGIESTNLESLKETGKVQNTRRDILEDIHKIHSFGIVTTPTLIMGFDHDSADVFAKQLAFVEAANLSYVGSSMLSAPRGTRLWHTLKGEGRVIKNEGHEMGYGFMSNIIPRNMTRVELMEGYLWFMRSLSEPRASFARLRRLVDTMKRKPTTRVPKWRVILKQDGRLFLNILWFFMIVWPRTCGPVVRQEFIKTMVHTWRKAPWLMERMLTACVHALGLHLKVKNMIAPGLERRIMMEKASPGMINLDSTELDLPKQFQAAYAELFPRVARRVNETIRDPSRSYDAATRVFVDFVQRWGNTFEGLEEHHRVFIDELCDRAVGELNAEPAPEAANMPEKSRLNPRSPFDRDDVYKAVEGTVRFHNHTGHAPAAPATM